MSRIVCFNTRPCLWVHQISLWPWIACGCTNLSCSSQIWASTFTNRLSEAIVKLSRYDEASERLRAVPVDGWSDRCYVAISAHARARKRPDPCSFGGFMLLCCSVGHSRQSRQQVGGLLLAVFALWTISPPKVCRACPFLPGIGPRWDTGWIHPAWDREGHPGGVHVLAK